MLIIVISLRPIEKDGQRQECCKHVDKIDLAIGNRILGHQIQHIDIINIILHVDIKLNRMLT